MITIRGEGLTIADIAAVARGAKVKLTDDPDVLRPAPRSREVIRRAVAERRADLWRHHPVRRHGRSICRARDSWSTSSAGAVATQEHDRAAAARRRDVRAAMLLRANSLMKGVSGDPDRDHRAVRGLPQRRRALRTSSSAARSARRATWCRSPISPARCSGSIPPSSSIWTARRWIRTRRWRGSASTPLEPRAQGGAGAQQRHRRLDRHRRQRRRPRPGPRSR